MLELPGDDFVRVAPDPVLAAFERHDQRVLRRGEVLRRVPVTGRVAAAHMPALQALSQVDPRVAQLETLFTTFDLRRSPDGNGREMGARGGHRPW